MSRFIRLIKINSLLNDTKTYLKLKSDPTPKYQDQLVKMLREWSREGIISESLKLRIYPRASEVPKLYGLPKIHKQGHPLRPIVSSIGSMSYKAERMQRD